MYIHFSLAHGNNHCHRHAEIFFDDSQVASGLQAAKQQSCPFCRLANKATIHRPCSYGFEAVLVLSGDFIQGRPGSSVIVRILDAFLPGLRPLQHLTSRQQNSHEWLDMATSTQQRIFWATQVRSKDLLSRMETQAFLVALHAKLEKTNNLRKPRTVLVCSLVKLRQLWLLHM